MIDEHARHVPPARLRPFVSGYSGYRQEGVAPARHRGLPSPELTFIVTLDDPLAIDAHPDPGQPAEVYDTLLGGLHTSPALVSHQGRWSGVQLGLTPLGARTLLGLPAGQLAHWDAEATDVVGAFAAELRELVVQQPTWAGRFAVLDRLLERRAAEAEADRRDTVRPEVGYAWRRLRQTRGGVGVAGLAAETGLSARRLGALFQAEIGLAPKEAGRVIRFTHARRQIERAAAGGPGATLARLAAECGFYDQAHLAREFRALAGCPPSQWLAEEFRFVQASPADLGE
ncbi:MAG TPA: helix-turn-helix domain-containing protein [Trebonia sp.]|nr:helix-turn-helix domain-containing protein [Trebonia sp.]